MRLLSAAFPRLGQFFPPGRWLVTGTFVGLVVALECFGRLAASDLHDGLAATALASGVMLVAARHKRQPLPWVVWLRGRAGRLFRIDYQCGYDLRGSPAYPARLPPAVWGLAVFMVAAAVLAGVVAAVVPGGVRGAVVRGSYVVYLAGLLGVWAGLAAAAVAGLYLPAFVYALFVDRRPGPRWGGRVLFWVFYLSSAWSLSQILPPAAPLTLAGLGIGAVIARLARRRPDDAAFLWRTGADRPIFAVPMRLSVAAILGLASLAVVVLVVTACGPTLLTPPPRSPFAAEIPPVAADAPDPVMVLTPAAGAAVAWLMPALAAAVAVSLAIARRLDPAARSVPTVTVQRGRPEEIAHARRAISAWGWRVRRPGGPPADVAVEIVPPAESEATAFDARWPLRASVADLADPTVRDRLARRDEITLRRAALRGVRTLFKRGMAERKARGGSFQFAPHWWFMDRMTREEPRRGRSGARHRAVGPPFQRLFSPRVRQHLHAVLRAAEVDIILVEDGVTPRRFAKVLRAVFELYDKHRGERRAEEHIFRGIPQVRVMLHEYAPEVPFKATRYAEPHLDELDRARVLHVFRDGGDHEAPVDDPHDFSWEPSPSLSFG